MSLHAGSLLGAGGGTGGITIGQAVAGGTPSTLLYNDSGGLIANSTSIPFGITLLPSSSQSALTLTGGTVTTSQPLISATQTWNAAGVTFTGLLVNPSGTSAAGSLIADFQFGSATQFSIRKDGQLSFSAGVGTLSGSGLVVSSGGFVAFGTRAYIDSPADAQLRLNNSASTVSVIAVAEAANTLALRNGVNAQTFNVYNTFTDASNYERLSLAQTASEWRIDSQAAGTGTARAVSIYQGGVQVFQFSTGGSYFKSNLNAATDNAFDIGANGSNRPRSLYLGTNATIGGQIIVSGIASDATHTDNTVCVDSTTKQFYAGSGAVGICLGTSSLRFKQDVATLAPGLAQLVRLEPISYRYRKGYGTSERDLYGFAAEQVVDVLPELVGPDAEGRPNSVDWAGLVPVIVNAIKELKAGMDVVPAILSAMKEQQEMIEELRRATRH